ncbi:MAG: cytochrome c3 family protein [Acidobacteriota bacterium]
MLSASSTTSESTIEICGACHEEQYLRVSSAHALLDDGGEWQDQWGFESSCVACHGDARAHIDSGGSIETMVGFTEDEPAPVRWSACLTCHSDDHAGFPLSSHARAGFACATCHEVHAPRPTANLLKPARPMDARLGAGSATCAECHGDVVTQFAFNERHRLQEGSISCVDCHNPHQASARTRLASFKQQACTTCHADVDGPFVFEHGASRVEGCVACHTPHGGPNRHMLKFQNVHDTCYSCHAVVPGFHLNFSRETNCSNCHSTIHGSNFDPAFLK